MPNRPITPLETKAWNLAKKLHSNQVRKFTGEPYFDAHVQKVNGTLKLYTSDITTLIVALLHDVIEDCFKNKWEGYAFIKKEFGKIIADLVLELTSDNEEMKHKFNNSKRDYLVHKMMNMSPIALTVKLSDRLNNIADAFTASERFRNNYYAETCVIIENVETLVLTRIQLLLLNDIKSKLVNIEKLFTI